MFEWRIAHMGMAPKKPLVVLYLEVLCSSPRHTCGLWAIVGIWGLPSPTMWELGTVGRSMLKREAPYFTG